MSNEVVRQCNSIPHATRSWRSAIPLSVLLSIVKMHKTKLTLPFDENLKSVSMQDVKETGTGGDKPCLVQESVWTLDKAFLKS